MGDRDPKRGPWSDHELPTRPKGPGPTGGKFDWLRIGIATGAIVALVVLVLVLSATT
jgi:hypothetical protein